MKSLSLILVTILVGSFSFATTPKEICTLEKELLSPILGKISADAAYVSVDVNYQYDARMEGKVCGPAHATVLLKKRSADGVLIDVESKVKQSFGNILYECQLTSATVIYSQLSTDNRYDILYKEALLPVAYQAGQTVIPGPLNCFQIAE